MNDPIWNLLLIESDETNTQRIRSASEGIRSAKIRLTCVAGADAAFPEDTDAVLACGRAGLDFLCRWASKPETAPVLFIHDGQPAVDEAEAYQAGVADCLTYEELTPRSLERSLRFAFERRQLREAVKPEGEDAQSILSAFLENIPTRIIIADGAEGRIRTVSRFGIELMGATADEMIGLTLDQHPGFFKVYHLDGVTPARAEELPLYRAIRSGETVTDEEWATLIEEGRKTILSASAGPIRNEAGEITGGIIVIRDVTESKQAEQNLAYQARILDKVHDAIIATDENFTITAWNDAAVELYGWEAAEAIGKNINDLTSTLYRPGEIDRALQAYIRQGYYQVECVQHARDGSQLQVESSGIALSGADGRINGYIIANRNITERKKAEEERERLMRRIKEGQYRVEKLAAEAQRHAGELKAIFDAISDPVLIFDMDGRILRANHSAIQLLGFDPVWRQREEIIEHLGITRTDGTPIAYEDLPVSRLLKGKPVSQDRLRYVRDDGEYRYFNVTGNTLYSGGKRSGAVLVFHDVTERENLMMWLESERAKLSAMVANAPEAIVMTDAAGDVVLSNPQADTLYFRAVPNGSSREGDRSWNICYPDGRPFMQEDLPLYRSAKFGETHINLELLLLSSTGEERYVLMSTAPILDRKRKITGAVGVFQDITQKKQVEEEIRRNTSQIEIQHYLTQYRERERLNIAHDLHDGPLQGLIATTFKVKGLIQSEGDGITEPLEQLQASLQEQIKELRRFCNELRPPTLAPFGLEKAIRSHMDDFRQQYPDFDIELDLEPDGKTLPETVRLTLFRIYRELLNNLVKHSQASRVNISFRLDGERAFFEMKDDGVGFTAPDNWVEFARQGHLGLVGVRERAESIDGKVKLQSSPGKGTKVAVMIPYSSERGEA